MCTLSTDYGIHFNIEWPTNICEIRIQFSSETLSRSTWDRNDSEKNLHFSVFFSPSFLFFLISDVVHSCLWPHSLTTRSEMVFCYQNCSDLLWEFFFLVIEKNFWNSRLKAEYLKIFEITRAIYSYSERSEQFVVTDFFLTCSWRFLMPHKLKQL